MFGRLILTISGIVLAIGGTATLFAPEELARALDPAASAAVGVAIQAAGSGLLGLAVVNWMSRATRIGGIYGRPLALGNFLLFVVSGLALGKAAAAGIIPIRWLALGVLLGGMAACFAWLTFLHDPLRKPANKA